MKLSLHWIRKYVDLPQDINLETLSHDLTMRTVEVEGAVNPAENLKHILVGIIREITPHPQADMLKVCLVDIGQDEPSTIVCGGSNISLGLPVAVATPGALVRWHGQGEPVAIKTTKLRGIKSEGMICAASEMQLEELFPAGDDHEILDLTAFPAKPGTPVATALGLDDIILEIDNKSLTNRPDLWCHYGIARELAAIYQLPLQPLPVFQTPEGLPQYPVSIANPDRCQRYTALQYEGLHNGPSPYWLKLALWKVGIRPISSLVDITNYVMLAVGQPTHAFDKNMVQQEIVVRTAKPGEELTLLDGKHLQLSGQDLMICDAKEPIALGGIMGGEKDSILPHTDNMLLEIANFTPRGIRRSASKYQIRTESAIRNEKGLDTQRVDQAMAVADQLIRGLYPEARLTAFHDNYPSATKPPVVTVQLDWLEKRLGRSLSITQAQQLLSPLGFSIEQSKQDLLVTVPTWRATGDVSERDDVLEEVARMIGYEDFSYIPPVVALDQAINQPWVSMERNTREYLAFQCGLQEVFTYPWVNQQYLLAAGVSMDKCLQLASPPSPAYACLRPSLIPGLLEVVANNLRYFEDFAVFEAAQVFAPVQGASSDTEETLPKQDNSMAAALVGKDARLLFRQAKGLLEAMPRAVMAAPFTFAQVQKPSWADAKAWLNVFSGEVLLGNLGLLSNQTLRAADIKRSMIAMLEINIDLVSPLPSRSNEYQPLPHFPLVTQDFSVLVDESVSWAEISQTLEKSARKIDFIEEYRGKQVPDGKKSLTFSLTFGSDEGTLSTAQIDEKVNAVKKRLTKLGAELRM